MTTTFRPATVEDAKRLSALMLAPLDNKTGAIYREQVQRFGIPDEYVRRAFSVEALTKTTQDEKQVFLVAVEDDRPVGFAQTIRGEKQRAELDRLFVVPEKEGKGIGTELLRRTLVVRADRDEIEARRFYEKHGFQLVGEATVQAPWGNELHFVNYELAIPTGLSV